VRKLSFLDGTPTWANGWVILAIRFSAALGRVKRGRRPMEGQMAMFGKRTLPLILMLLAGCTTASSSIEKGPAFDEQFSQQQAVGAERASIASGPISDPRSADDLIAALRDPNAGVRFRAAYLLGQKKDPRAAGPLIAALKYTRFSANSYGWESDVHQVTVDALVEIGAPAVESLIGGLKDPDERVRDGSVSALAKIKDPRSIEPLFAAFKDSDPLVRADAIQAVGNIANTGSTERVIATLRDRDYRVRLSAVQVLGELNDPGAVQPLIAALKDERSIVRQSAADALGEIKDSRAVEPLIAALGDRATDKRAIWETGSVAASAAIALGKIKDPRAVEPLIVALKNVEVFSRTRAATALIEIGRPAVEPLIGALLDPNSDTRQRAATALEAIGDPRAYDVLLKAFRAHDTSVIMGASRFFIERGESGSEDGLIDALDKTASQDEAESLAQEFLNCGNPKLEAAGQQWASAHGYRTFAVSAGDHIAWGSKP
jgi:HEAT repeat protein